MQQFKQAGHVVVTVPESLSVAARVRHDEETTTARSP
jgi:hypothetical protein